MLKINQSISITGQSYIKTQIESSIETQMETQMETPIETPTENNNTTEQIIAYMNASIPDHGDININKSIQNKELFSKHKQTVLDDFAEFETYVYSLS